MSIEVRSTSAEQAFKQMAKDKRLPDGHHCLKVTKQTVKANTNETSAWGGHAMLVLTMQSIDPDTGEAFSFNTITKFALTTAIVGDVLPAEDRKQGAKKNFGQLRASAQKELMDLAKACGLIEKATPEALDTLSKGLCDDSLTFEGCTFYALVKYPEGDGDLPNINRPSATPIPETPLAYESERAPF